MGGAHTVGHIRWLDLDQRTMGIHRVCSVIVLLAALQSCHMSEVNPYQGWMGTPVPKYPNVIHAPSSVDYVSCTGAITCRSEARAMTSSREEPTAPSVVRGVPIIPDAQFRDDNALAIIYMIGDPKKSDWVIPDTNSEFLIKPNDEFEHAAAFLGCVCIGPRGSCARYCNG